jgi:hypothetical protein
MPVITEESVDIVNCSGSRGSRNAWHAVGIWREDCGVGCRRHKIAGFYSCHGDQCIEHAEETWWGQLDARCIDDPWQEDGVEKVPHLKDRVTLALRARAEEVNGFAEHALLVRRATVERKPTPERFHCLVHRDQVEVVATLCVSERRPGEVA